MSSYAAPAVAQPGRSPWVDGARSGSTKQQAAIGVLGIVLALTLLIGQVAVATTKGIQTNLHANIKRLTDGNATMKGIIERAAPTVLMEQVVAKQGKILANTHTTLGVLNGHMDSIAGTTDGLAGTVDAMEGSSASLAGGIAGMNSDTEKIVGLLEPLPATTGRMHGSLQRIAGDSNAINGELGQISGKMEGYGLPHAKKARQ